MPFAVFAVVVLAGCVTALGFGAVALNTQRRSRTLARYPLQIVSLAIATPFFVLSLLGIFVGVGIAADEGGAWSWALGVLAVVAAACCVIAVAMCARAARGKYASGPHTPAILGFGAPLIALLGLGGIDGGGGMVLAFGLMVSAGAGANGMIAARINAARRKGPFASCVDATLPTLGHVSLAADAQAGIPLPSPAPPVGSELPE